MDLLARIRAEVGYEPESGEPYGFDVIERYIEALEAHVGAMEMVSVLPQPRGAVEALTTLANPTHKARTEEAALVQIEVVQIAQDALDRLGGQ